MLNVLMVHKLFKLDNSHILIQEIKMISQKQQIHSHWQFSSFTLNRLDLCKDYLLVHRYMPFIIVYSLHFHLNIFRLLNQCQVIFLERNHLRRIQKIQAWIFGKWLGMICVWTFSKKYEIKIRNFTGVMIYSSLSWDGRESKLSG